MQTLICFVLVPHMWNLEPTQSVPTPYDTRQLPFVEKYIQNIKQHLNNPAEMLRLLFSNCIIESVVTVLSSYRLHDEVT